MFKSVFGGHSGPVDSKLDTEALRIDSNGSCPANQQQQADVDEEAFVGGPTIITKKSSAVKRGRKKLSSMMNRLHVGGKKNGQPNELGDDEDEAEDDETDEGAAAQEAKGDRRRSSAGNILKRRQSKQLTAGATEDDDEDDKRYILPEEQCDIPTFLNTRNASAHLIDETRRLLKERFAKNPDFFYESDYKRMLADDWTVTRFLLRRRLDPKRTAKLMEECGKFRKSFKMSEVELWEFPIEFHKAGGLFKYLPDRVGNVTMYMRIKMYRRVPEISDVFKAFILCVLEQCDVANNGRGTAVIFDLTGCGLQNVDLAFLSWLLTSFRNYCPKGVSYIVVYNLPWILNATCKLAMSWMSESNRRALRFVQGKAIEEFIAPENLPDYLGGTCKLNYREVPEGSLPATEVCHRFDLTPKQALKIKELFKEYLDDEDESGCVSNSGGNGCEKQARVPDEQADQEHLEASEATLAANGVQAIGDSVQVVDLVAQATRFAH